MLVLRVSSDAEVGVGWPREIRFVERAGGERIISLGRASADQATTGWLTQPLTGPAISRKHAEVRLGVDGTIHLSQIGQNGTGVLASGGDWIKVSKGETHIISRGCVLCFDEKARATSAVPTLYTLETAGSSAVPSAPAPDSPAPATSSSPTPYTLETAKRSAPPSALAPDSSVPAAPPSADQWTWLYDAGGKAADAESYKEYPPEILRRLNEAHANEGDNMACRIDVGGREQIIHMRSQSWVVAPPLKPDPTCSGPTCRCHWRLTSPDLSLTWSGPRVGNSAGQWTQEVACRREARGLRAVDRGGRL